MKSSTIYVAVDAIVFGYTAKEGLSVLLIQRKYDPFQGSWAIPGGFVREEESLEEAVVRELEEETGIKVNYLEQLYTFGQPKRDPRRRVLSVAYYGLVRPDVFELHASTDAEDARWFNINKLPELAFDHLEILHYALTRLRNKISYEPVGFELLDTVFPFSDLHKLYETLKGGEIDRRNFKKKILKLGILAEQNQKKQEGRGRPGTLYSFSQEKYKELKEGGIVLEF